MLKVVVDFEAEIDGTTLIDDHSGEVEEGFSQRVELLCEGGVILKHGQLVIDHQIEAPQSQQHEARIL